MGKKVLVADDSSTIRRIVVDALGDVGVTETVEVPNGPDALSHFEKENFDLVVIDHCMPGMSGLNVTRQIRATGSAVPILMVTASGAAREDVEEAAEAGVSDYLMKPFTAESLREKLAKFCQ